MSLNLPVNLRVLGYDIDTKAPRDCTQSACGTVVVQHTCGDGFGREMWHVWVRVNEHFMVYAHRPTLREAECIVAMREVDE